MTGLRCAYVVSRYPSVTHTFVLREVQALRERGNVIETVTVRRPDPAEVIGPLERAEQERTFALRPVSIGRLVRAHLRALSPAYFRALAETIRDSATRQPRDLLWQLFYFAQGVLLWDWMRSRSLRHVHAHHANVGSDVAMIAARFGGPGWSWSFTMHGPTEFDDPAGHKLALKVARADSIVAISEYARARLIELASNGHAGKISIVHCGVQPDAYRREGSAAAAGPLRVLNIGRMDPRKGQVLLVDALARMDTPVELTIVGDGPERATVEQRANELGVDVTLTGAVDQDRVRELLASSDAFVLPSYAEGVPIVLMEAMATGVPVVATRIAGVPELVEDDVCGLLVEPGDTDAIAAALTRLAHDPDLRARLAAAGRRKVEDEFAIDASAAALEPALAGPSRRYGAPALAGEDVRGSGQVD